MYNSPFAIVVLIIGLLVAFFGVGKFIWLFYSQFKAHKQVGSDKADIFKDELKDLIWDFILFVTVMALIYVALFHDSPDVLYPQY